MSEDEVKPQAEEPTPEAVKKEKETKKDEPEEMKVEEENVTGKEEELEDDSVKEEEVEEEEKNTEMLVEVNKKEVKAVKPKPQKEVKVPKLEAKTPEKAGVPLYDQPLEMSGKRDRKKVERFIQEEKKEELKFEGSGTPLGEIPFIEAMITKTHQDELKVLHRVAYNRPGSGREIKENLRKFNGFAYTKEDKKYETKVSNTEKIMKAEITRMLKLLGLERSGTKGEVVERFLDFMLKPEDFGKKPPKVKKGKGRGRPKKSLNKSKNDSVEAVSEAESAEKSSSDDDDEEEEEEVVEEEEEEEKVKKPKKTPARKTPAKKTPAKKTPAKRPASAKKPAKVSKTVSSDDSDSESDDEPLAKKVKQPPTDGEIKAMVKKILDGANLEEVTMKSVCRQVYDSYPDFDLTHKKDFIKETVKSIIS